jgi:hypothetical protein
LADFGAVVHAHSSADVFANKTAHAFSVVQADATTNATSELQTLTNTDRSTVGGPIGCTVTSTENSYVNHPVSCPDFNANSIAHQQTNHCPNTEPDGESVPAAYSFADRAADAIAECAFCVGGLWDLGGRKYVRACLDARLY